MRFSQLMSTPIENHFSSNNKELFRLILRGFVFFILSSIVAGLICGFGIFIAFGLGLGGNGMTQQEIEFGNTFLLCVLFFAAFPYLIGSFLFFLKSKQRIDSPLNKVIFLILQFILFLIPFILLLATYKGIFF